MTGNHHGDESGRAGFSLVAVLVFMLIVSAIVVPFAVTAKTRLLIASNGLEQERLSLLAEGLSNVVSSELTNGPVETLAMNSTPMGCQSGELTFEVRIQDHNGLIDLNAADADLLALGFVSLGFDRGTAGDLAKAALRFRVNASAFAAQSDPATSSVGPLESKGAPFESVSELKEFSGLGSKRLEDLYAVFTVHSKRGTTSLEHAPGRLRASLVEPGTGAATTQVAPIAPAFTVEVTARRNGSAIVGRSGFIIEMFPDSVAGFRRLARNPTNAVDPAPARSFTTNCDALFGAEAAQALREFAS
ncbi:hypothetical protein ACFX5Q_34170 [Mesorhizobium sp. IMUNJ 23033]|uniref:hypothetical protein n=1 Tax=Mesorhizobium sp. IMUNJ 23033 TaxID=3378039 RepID=UPI00384DB26C